MPKPPTYEPPDDFKSKLEDSLKSRHKKQDKYPAIGRAVYSGMKDLPRLAQGANPKDDMWAVGITLLHLHGVEFLFERKEKLQEVLQDKNAHPFILKHRELLSSLLSEHREHRPTAANAQRILAKPPTQRRRY